MKEQKPEQEPERSVSIWESEKKCPYCYTPMLTGGRSYWCPDKSCTFWEEEEE